VGGDDPEAFKALLDKAVTDLDLSVRAENCLEAQNIKTIRELVVRSETELLALRNFGETSLDDIKIKLGGLGLTLGMKLDEIGEGIG